MSPDQPEAQLGPPLVHLCGPPRAGTLMIGENVRDTPDPDAGRKTTRNGELIRASAGGPPVTTQGFK